jgi:hypothetical protein
MRRPAPPSSAEAQVLSLGWALAGALLIAGGVLAADLAVLHMRTAGAICGAGSIPHCSWCFGAAGLVVAGLAAFLQAAQLRPIPNPLPTRG